MNDIIVYTYFYGFMFIVPYFYLNKKIKNKKKVEKVEKHFTLEDIPLEIENIIMNYKNDLEHTEKFKKTLDKINEIEHYEEKECSMGNGWWSSIYFEDKGITNNFEYSIYRRENYDDDIWGSDEEYDYNKYGLLVVINPYYNDKYLN